MRLLTKIIDSKTETQRSYAISKSASSKVLFSTPSSAFSLQKSLSVSEIDDKRGFKPSDRNDPAKRKFLQNLTQKVFKIGLVSPIKFCHFHIPVPLHFPKDMILFFFLPRFRFHFSLSKHSKAFISRDVSWRSGLFSASIAKNGKTCAI